MVISQFGPKWGFTVDHHHRYKESVSEETCEQHPGYRNKYNII